MRLQTGILISSLLVLSACNERISKLASSSGPTNFKLDSCTPVDFAAVKAVVLDVSCKDCHSWAKRYDTVAPKINSSDRGIEAMIRSARMPDTSEGTAPLTSEQQDLILRWLESGAPEVAQKPPGCETAPKPVEPTEPVIPPSPVEPAPEPVTPPAPAPVPEPLVLDFATVKAEVFDVSCKECHSWTQSFARAQKKALDTSEKGMKAQIVSGSMPDTSEGMAPLTEAQKDLLLKWIDAGAPETAATPEPPAPPPPPAVKPGNPLANYEALRANILESTCLRCHGAGSERDFSTYQSMISNADIFDLQNPENSVLIIAVRKVGRGQMPTVRSGLPHLTDDQIATMVDWIKAGLPEKL